MTTSHTLFGQYEFALWYDGSLAVWRNPDRTGPVYDGLATTGINYGYVTPGTYYVEALGATSDALISLVRMQSANAGHIDPLYVSAVDLDVDSDNNDGYTVPDRTLNEDQIEDDSTKPGKFLTVNDGDYDLDDVPDFADGYDLYGQQAYYASGSFTPVVVQVDPSLPSTSTAFVRRGHFSRINSATVCSGTVSCVMPVAGLSRIR